MARWARAVGVLLFAAGAVFALPQAARGDAGWWGDLDKGQSVRLSDVVAAPEGFRGRTITFVCVFHQREREFNPLRTRFNSDRYDNVSVWPDGKALWSTRDFEQDFPFLYVDRKHPQRDDLFNQTVMTRLEVTGRIEAVLDGAPFIEMTSFRVTGHRLGQDVVEKMMRAETFARAGDPTARDIAIDNAQSALEDMPDLAPIYAALIRVRLTELLKVAGRVSDAQRVALGERLGPMMTPVQGQEGARGAEPFAAPTTSDVNLPGTPACAVPLPGSTNLPGSPTDAAHVPLPGSANLPGTPIEVPLPGTTNIPGMPVDVPLPGTTNIPGTPVDTRAPPSKPLLPPPATRLPPAPPAPATAPGSAAPGGPVPGNAAPGALPPPPPLGPIVYPPPEPVAAPVIVDPPLPPPAPGGKPPVRRPRLAGVK